MTFLKKGFDNTKNTTYTGMNTENTTYMGMIRKKY